MVDLPENRGWIAHALVIQQSALNDFSTSLPLATGEKNAFAAVRLAHTLSADAFAFANALVAATRDPLDRVLKLPPHRFVILVKTEIYFAAL